MRLLFITSLPFVKTNFLYHFFILFFLRKSRTCSLNCFTVIPRTSALQGCCWSLSISKFTVSKEVDVYEPTLPAEVQGCDDEVDTVCDTGEKWSFLTSRWNQSDEMCTAWPRTSLENAASKQSRWQMLLVYLLSISLVCHAMGTPSIMAAGFLGFMTSGGSWGFPWKKKPKLSTHSYRVLAPHQEYNWYVHHHWVDGHLIRPYLGKLPHISHISNTLWNVKITSGWRAFLGSWDKLWYLSPW